MTAATDPVTLALTGALPFMLIVAAALALIVSLALLWSYKRAVLKSMRARGGRGSAPPEAHTGPFAAPPPEAPLEIAIAQRTEPLDASARSVLRRALRSPWQAVGVYACAGAGFAAVMTAAFLVTGDMAFLPFRFLVVFTAFTWPLVITIGLVAGAGRKAGLIAALAHFWLLFVFSALGRAPELTIGQIAQFWLVVNGPATVLLWAFLNRRVRAVGPLVVVFMLIAVIGSQVLITAAGSSDAALRGVVEVGDLFGLGAVGLFWGLALTGFCLFAVLGWLALMWIRRRYEVKRISDQSLTIDAIWLLFGVSESISFVFAGWPWIFAGLAAFAVYKIVAWIGFALLARARQDGPRAPILLLLRVFSLGKRSERLFDALGKHWLRVGSMRMIAGPDLATTTVEPHEFLDFVGGRLARRFIKDAGSLNQRVAEIDVRPDWDGRYRVADFFCHDDTWKMVLKRLVAEADAVLMDLRGFTPSNAGCAFEIEELLNLMPLSRVVLVTDRTTDMAFLERVARESWGRLRALGPNRELQAPRLTLVQGGELRGLLRAVCAAARHA